MHAFDASASLTRSAPHRCEIVIGYWWEDALLLLLLLKIFAVSWLIIIELLHGATNTPIYSWTKSNNIVFPCIAYARVRGKMIGLSQDHFAVSTAWVCCLQKHSLFINFLFHPSTASLATYISCVLALLWGIWGFAWYHLLWSRVKILVGLRDAPARMVSKRLSWQTNTAQVCPNAIGVHKIWQRIKRDRRLY